MIYLNSKALSVNTNKAYKNVISYFKQFCTSHGISVSLPFHVIHVKKYIAYLFTSHYAVSTALTHMSAISFYHKINGFSFSDPTKDFQVQHMLKGYKNSQSNSLVKSPFSLNDLASLVKGLPLLFHDFYCVTLFSAMIVFGFFLGLRIGEMTVSEHNLDISDISMLQDSIKIVFRSFKHSKSSSVHILKARNDFLCPHTAMTNYLKLRNDIVGPLFLLNNKAVSGSIFSKKFKQLLVQTGFDAKKFSPHSLRISAARMWASQGLSDAQIRLLGRWHSNAFKCYLKGVIYH